MSSIMIVLAVLSSFFIIASAGEKNSEVKQQYIYAACFVIGLMTLIHLLK